VKDWVREEGQGQENEERESGMNNGGQGRVRKRCTCMYDIEGRNELTT